MHIKIAFTGGPYLTRIFFEFWGIFLHIVNQQKITQKIHFRWILTLIPHLTWKLRACVKWGSSVLYFFEFARFWLVFKPQQCMRFHLHTYLCDSKADWCKWNFFQHWELGEMRQRRISKKCLFPNVVSIFVHRRL